MPARRRAPADAKPRGDKTDSSDKPSDVDAADESGGSRGRPKPRRLPAAQAAQAALRHIVDLTGREPVGVVSVDPGDDGWLVSVEVIEDRRVPSSADILAMYEAEIDMDGELLSYGRTQRYMRGHGVNGARR